MKCGYRCKLIDRFGDKKENRLPKSFTLRVKWRREGGKERKPYKRFKGREGMKLLSIETQHSKEVIWIAHVIKFSFEFCGHEYEFRLADRLADTRFYGFSEFP